MGEARADSSYPTLLGMLCTPCRTCEWVGRAERGTGGVGPGAASDAGTREEERGASRKVASTAQGTRHDANALAPFKTNPHDDCSSACTAGKGMPHAPLERAGDLAKVLGF